ncbi:Coronin-like protein crn1, partial [Ceratobasidium sp. 392]
MDGLSPGDEGSGGSGDLRPSQDHYNQPDLNSGSSTRPSAGPKWRGWGGTLLRLPPRHPPTIQAPKSHPPCARHTAPVLDVDWSPFSDSVVVSGGEDGRVLVWKVESSQFDGWGGEWRPRDFDPVASISGSGRKVGQVLFHPIAENVVAASTVGDGTVRLWDLANTDDAKISFTGHADTIRSLTWNPAGTLLATTCRDRKIRLFDPRAGSKAVRVGDGHGGTKSARVVWMGAPARIVTIGFSRMSERQLGVRDA